MIVHPKLRIFSISQATYESLIEKKFLSFKSIQKSIQFLKWSSIRSLSKGTKSSRRAKQRKTILDTKSFWD